MLDFIRTFCGVLLANAVLWVIAYLLFKQELVNEWRHLRDRLGSSRPMHHKHTYIENNQPHKGEADEPFHC